MLSRWTWLLLWLAATLLLCSTSTVEASQLRKLHRTLKSGASQQAIATSTSTSSATRVQSSVASHDQAAADVSAADVSLPHDQRDDENNSTDSKHDVRPHITVMANGNALNKEKIISYEQSDPDALADKTEHAEFLLHQQKLLDDEARDRRMDAELHEHDELRKELDDMGTIVTRQELEIANEKQNIKSNAREAEILREESNENQQEMKMRGQLEHDHRKQVVDGAVQRAKAQSIMQRHQELTNSLEHKYAAQAAHLQQRALEQQLSDVAHQKQMQNLQAMHDAQVRWRTEHEQHPVHLAQQHEKDAWHVTEHIKVVHRPEWQWANMVSPTLPTPRVNIAMGPSPIVPPLHGGDTTLTEPGVYSPLSGAWTSDTWEHEYEQNSKPMTHAKDFYRNELTQQADGGAMRNKWWFMTDKHEANMEARDQHEQQLKREHLSDQKREDQKWDSQMKEKKVKKDEFSKIPAEMTALTAKKVADKAVVEAQALALKAGGAKAIAAMAKIDLQLLV